MEKLRDAWRGDLFPSAEAVVSMSREFGVPMTAEDFEGKFISNPCTRCIWNTIDTMYIF